MVNQSVVNYLKEGQKRGFSTHLLKQKLLEAGFNEEDISEAISSIGGVEKKIEAPVEDARLVKKDLEKKPNQRKGGKKWMKIAGISGIILLILILVGFVATTFFSIRTATFFLSNPSFSQIFIISFGVISLILVLLYFLGFVRLGKKLNVKKLIVGPWMIIISLFSYILYIIVWGIILKNSTNLTSLSGGAVSLVILALIFLLAVLGQVIFSLGLLAAGKDIRFEKATGILNVISSIFVIFSVTALVILYFSIQNSFGALGGAGGNVSFSPSLGLGGLSVLQTSIGLIYLVMVSWLGLYFTKLNSFILEILVLFDASKKFE